MPFNGSGIFARIHDFVTDRNNGVKIQATRMDDELDGFATGLSNCITKDGQTTVTNNIPFNGKKITNLGDASSDTDALNRRTGDGRYARTSQANTWTAANTFSEDVTFSASYDVTFNGTTTVNGTLTINDSAAPVLALKEGSDTRQIKVDGNSILFTNTSGTTVFTFDNSGNFTASANVTAYSDRRHKRDIEAIDPAEALAIVRNLAQACARYTMIQTGTRSIGLIAQDVQPHVPEVVGETEAGLHLAYGNLVAVVIPAIEYLARKVEDMTNGRL